MRPPAPSGRLARSGCCARQACPPPSRIAWPARRASSCGSTSAPAGTGRPGTWPRSARRGSGWSATWPTGSGRPGGCSTTSPTGTCSPPTTPGSSGPREAAAGRLPAWSRAGRHGGEHLGHVGVHLPLAGGGGDRHPVMAVAHEMLVADPVDLDRRNRLTAPLGQRQPFPPVPRPTGRGPEPAVEVAPRVDRADDRVHRYRLQPQPPLAAPAERADDLVKRHDTAAVTAPAAQAAAQRRQDLAPPGPQEVVLDVCPRESGI